MTDKHKHQITDDGERAWCDCGMSWEIIYDEDGPVQDDLVEVVFSSGLELRYPNG